MTTTEAHRGCLTCRQRHVECDNERSHCKTCLHAGVYCDGYQTGVISEGDLPPIRLRPRQRLRIFSSVPTERESRPDNHEPPPPNPVESDLVASGYNDEWLRTKWPPQLPVVVVVVVVVFSAMAAKGLIRDICRGVGRDNIALRCAVFSLGHLSPNPKNVMFVGMMPIVLKFSSASRYDSTRGLPSGSGPELGLTMAILCVQSLIDMKLGAFRRGLASVKQAGEVIAANQTAFCSSGPHRDVMQFWFSINAWYSMQCPPWNVHARVLPAATLKASWGILRSTPEKGHEIAALLCESRRLYARLSLFRLIESSGIASEDLANWPLSFQEIVNAGGPAPEEEYSMSALAALRDGLDGWHNSVGMNDRPVYAKTAELKAQLDSEPPGVRFESLWFQSYDAAMCYDQYAAAHALCSQHSLDVLTGKAARDESYTDEWIHLILQIVPGLRWDYDERNYLGLMWIVGQVVALRCTDPHIIAWIQKKASLLEDITPDWSCVLPKNLFGPLLAMQKDLLAQGQAAMHLFTEDAREVNTARQVLRVGLDLTTRKGFVDLLPENSMVAIANGTT